MYFFATKKHNICVFLEKTVNRNEKKNSQALYTVHNKEHYHVFRSIRGVLSYNGYNLA